MANNSEVSEEDFNQLPFDQVKVGDIIFSPLVWSLKHTGITSIPINNVRWFRGHKSTYHEQIVIDKVDGELKTVVVIRIGNLQLSSDDDAWTVFKQGGEQKSKKKGEVHVRPTEEQWANELNLLVPIEPNTVAIHGEYGQTGFVVKYDPTCQYRLPSELKRWACVGASFMQGPSFDTNLFRVYKDSRIDETSVAQLRNIAPKEAYHSNHRARKGKKEHHGQRSEASSSTSARQSGGPGSSTSSRTTGVKPWETNWRKGK